MAQSKRGCGCALAVLIVILGGLGYFGYKLLLPWWETKPPPPSGGELQVHVLDVGPIEGDSILIISPTHQAVLIDAGDTGKGKVVLDALKRYDVKQLALFIASNEHPDHIGGAPEVLKTIKAETVLYNGVSPPGSEPEVASGKAPANKKKLVKPAKIVRSDELPTTKAFNDLKSAAAQSGAQFKPAEPGQEYNLGGGARLVVLAPIQPFFTREQMRAGGNEPNANSVIVRLEYGDFSMLLPGDAETQTEQRLIERGIDVSAKVLKVAHHGSKYATSEDFIKHVNPEVAIISDGEYNRYGHPSQDVLDRLKAAGVRVYRTDLQGEITIITKGKNYEITKAKEAKSDIFAGRQAQKDDSARSGFIAYGDFGPPPRPPREKAAKK